MISKIKNRLSLALLVFSGVFISTSSAQPRNDSFFKDGDKVNFIGNSITHSGDFHHYILVYYATRFPGEKVTFYNSGIRGDNANSFLRRMDRDILPRKANWSVVMAGMNDVNRSLYAEAKQPDLDIEARKERAIKDYEGYLEAVIQRLQKTGSKVILQKPSIYDQTGDLPAPNLLGVNDALQKCCQIMDALANKYKLNVVDYWSIMSQINKRIQEKSPQATIVGNDRVHPGPPGNFIMAYQFLKSINSPEYVSAIEIENGALKEAKFCDVTGLSVNAGIIEFKSKEESLPFPVPKEAEKALSLVSFTGELNRQMLKIRSLSKGKYLFTIDGIDVGYFTHEEFSKGLNLANMEGTPQYRQALSVAKQALIYRDTQRKLRDIKFVEFSYLPENLWEADLGKIKEFIGNKLLSLASANDVRHPGVKSAFQAYLQDKPGQHELEEKAAALPSLIYSAARPVAHTYRISKAD